MAYRRDTQDAKHLCRLLRPPEPHARLCISHRRNAARNYSKCVLSKVGGYRNIRNEQARSLQNINKVCNKIVLSQTSKNSDKNYNQQSLSQLSLTAPEVALQPVTQGEPRERLRRLTPIHPYPRQKSAFPLSHSLKICTIQLLKKSEAFQRQLCIMNYEL